MSDASTDRSQRAWLLSDLWNGARTTSCHWRGRKCRLDRHEAAVLGQHSIDHAFALACDERVHARRSGAQSDRLTLHYLDFISACVTGGALGRLAILCSRLAINREPQPEHVYTDRPRCRSRFRL